MWRWSWINSGRMPLMIVFSTYVEVILTTWLLMMAKKRILHVCGGDPSLYKSDLINCWYSPRMWRWSSKRLGFASDKTVFSTYVEVILNSSNLCVYRSRILHVCGGDPMPPLFAESLVQYSPRMWRWSYKPHLLDVSPLVFSTYVEVILPNSQSMRYISSILHVCGGDPIVMSQYLNMALYSPRMWRWSHG